MNGFPGSKNVHFFKWTMSYFLRNSYMVQFSNFIFGQLRSKKEKWLILNHTVISNRARANPRLLTQWFFLLIQQATADHLHVPSTVAGLGYLMANRPEWVRGFPSFLWSLSLGSELVSVTFISDYFMGGVCSPQSLLGWHLWHLAQRDSEEAFLAEDALGVVQDELGHRRC